MNEFSLGYIKELTQQGKEEKTRKENAALEAELENMKKKYCYSCKKR